MNWGLTGNGFVYGTIESRKWELTGPRLLRTDDHAVGQPDDA